MIIKNIGFILVNVYKIYFLLMFKFDIDKDIQQHSIKERSSKFKKINFPGIIKSERRKEFGVKSVEF